MHICLSHSCLKSHRMKLKIYTKFLFKEHTKYSSETLCWLNKNHDKPFWIKKCTHSLHTLYSLCCKIQADSLPNHICNIICIPPSTYITLILYALFPHHNMIIYSLSRYLTLILRYFLYARTSPRNLYTPYIPHTSSLPPPPSYTSH